MAEKKKPTEIPGVKITPLEKVDEAPLDLFKAPLTQVSSSFHEDSRPAWAKTEAESLINTIAQQGENQLRQVARVEVKTFDSSFLDALEVGLAAVSKIISNPRTFIKELTEIENVEKAKKVSIASIQHFATHSQYLRTVTEQGEVIPEKILTIHSETNTAIYENRFVMTLIKRCLSFIDQRYKFIEEHGETLDSDELFIQSKTPIGGVNYNLTLRLKASIPSLDAGNSEKNNRLLERLSGYRQMCADFLRSQFMVQMKGAKDVTSPVHMTNMLLKHPDYHAAYVLWEFIDQYESLGVSYDVQETVSDFDEAYLQKVYELIGQAILTMHSRHIDQAVVTETKAKKVTPQVIFGIDDLTYDDGKFVYDAYPDAANHPGAFDCLNEIDREEHVEHRVTHLTTQQQASGVARKKIQKTKDQREYAAAAERQQQEQAQQEALEEQKRLEAEEQARLQAERDEQERKRKEEALKAEQEAYLREKARLEGK